jgi:hypothetical protein
MSGYLNRMCISSVKERRGEERRYLPDVKDKDCLYKFVGQESWQVTPGIFCVLFLRECIL